jgi:tetratricopeptide (TPR) repeat protein
MKTIFLRTLACYFALLFSGAAILGSTTVRADQRAASFLDAVELYENHEYSEAAGIFESLTREGIRNPELYYNIANAHLKDGRLGPAILWYERALRLDPGDPDLRFNLDYARSLLEDEPADIGSPVLQVLFFWKDLLGVSVWQWIGISAGFIFWCLWAVICFFKKPVLKPFLYGFLALALISAGTALYLKHQSVFHPRAVILGKAVSVRSGFSEDTTELFVLHEGTLVAVEKETDGFLKIQYAEDKIGWVSDTMAEVI